MVEEATLLGVENRGFFAFTCCQTPNLLKAKNVEFVEFVDEHVCETLVWFQHSMAARWENRNQHAVKSKYFDLVAR